MSSPLHLYVQRSGSILDSHSALDPERCPVTVASDMGRVSRFSQCKHKPKPDLVRPVRGDDSQDVDMPVCGMHARQFDKRVEEQKKWQEERARDRADDAKAEKGVADLKARGIEARPSTGGKVVVDADEVLAALER